jgi:hypothetical protein
MSTSTDTCKVCGYPAPLDIGDGLSECPCALRSHSGPPLYRTALLSDLSTGLRGPIVKWHESNGWSLAMLGPPGCGKSHAAWAYRHWRQWLSGETSTWIAGQAIDDDFIYSRMLSHELLIIDDLINRVDAVDRGLDSRYSRGLPTIVIANSAAVLGDRSWSRLHEGTVIDLSGAVDKRSDHALLMSLRESNAARVGAWRDWWSRESSRRTDAAHARAAEIIAAYERGERPAWSYDDLRGMGMADKSRIMCAARAVVTPAVAMEPEPTSRFAMAKSA